MKCYIGYLQHNGSAKPLYSSIRMEKEISSDRTLSLLATKVCLINDSTTSFRGAPLSSSFFKACVFLETAVSYRSFIIVKATIDGRVPIKCGM